MTDPILTSLKPRACEVCSSTDGVLRCAGCHVVYYCGREHQLSHRAEHKAACAEIKNARTHLENEEKKLRDHPGDMFTPPNVLEVGVGRFWYIRGTRDYMKARYRLVDYTLQLFGIIPPRTEAVQISLNHLLDMLRLCRADNMSLRSQVPALYIRLGKDQAAYDFMKWWATTGNKRNYDWGDMDAPYLDIKDADVFESPRGMWTEKSFMDLSHAVAVALVKVRIYLDLKTLLDIADSGRPAQGNSAEHHGDFVGSIVRSRPELLVKDKAEIGQLLDSMTKQIMGIYFSVRQRNPHYWRLMLDNPGTAVDRPDTYMPGSKEEACLVLGYNLPSWMESFRAIGVIRALDEVITEEG